MVGFLAGRLGGRTGHGPWREERGRCVRTCGAAGRGGGGGNVCANSVAATKDDEAASLPSPAPQLPRGTSAGRGAGRERHAPDSSPRLVCVALLSPATLFNPVTGHFCFGAARRGARALRETETKRKGYQ